MDCIDCHNRPTHVYTPPDRAVDQAMAANRISTTLPFAKQQGVQILTAEYKTNDAGHGRHRPADSGLLPREVSAVGQAPTPATSRTW